MKYYVAGVYSLWLMGLIDAGFGSAGTELGPGTDFILLTSLGVSSEKAECPSLPKFLLGLSGSCWLWITFACQLEWGTWLLGFLLPGAGWFVARTSAAGSPG